jgi:hypothetical protein
MATCPECGGQLRRYPELPYSLICENLAAKAVERRKAGDHAPVTHADLRDGIQATPMLERIEGRAREIGKLIGNQMPEGYGFLLTIFRFNGPEFTWISNAEREDMVRSLREFLHKLTGDGGVTVPKDALMNTLAYCWVRGWYAGQDGAKTDEGKIHAAQEEFAKLLGLRKDAQ